MANLKIEAVTTNGGAQFDEYSVFIDENVGTGTIVGKVTGWESTPNITFRAHQESGVDQDIGGRYHIVKVGNEYFLAVKNGGTQMMDFEDEIFGGAHQQMWFEAVDGTGRVVHNSIYDVWLNDLEPEGPVNQAPTTPVYTGNGAINETVGNNALVGTLSATDPDGTTPTFVFVNAQAGSNGLISLDGAFKIVGTQILVNDASQIQVTSGTSRNFSYDVKSFDGSLQSATATVVSITVNDVAANPAPTNVRFESTGNGTIIIDENKTAIDKIIATDNDTLSYSFKAGGNPGDLFVLSPSGVLSLAAGVDYETMGGSKFYDVVVLVTDNVNPPVEKTLRVNINDINEAPSISGAANTQVIADTASVQPFSAVTISDQDINEVVTVVVTMDAANKGAFGNFSIGTYNMSTGTYTVTGTVASVNSALQALRFEPRDKAAGAPAETTNFTISVSDDGGLTGPNNTGISVQATAPAANPAPTNVRFESTGNGTIVIDENTTAIDKIIATDNDTLSYSFKADGNPGGLFVLSPSGVLSLAAGVDYETMGGSKFYDVVVLVTDNVNPPVEKTLRVNINNINDAPVVVAPVTTRVTADTKDIQPFDVVTISDQDLNEVLTVVITMDTATKGEFITPGAGIYNKNLGTYTIIGTVAEVNTAVQALRFDPRNKPAGSVSETTNFTISVNDGEASAVPNTNISVSASTAAGNAAPTNVRFESTGSGTITINENTTEVGSLKADDADVLTYRFKEGGNPDSLFTLSKEGVLSLAAGANYETMGANKFLEVIVVVTDGVNDVDKTLRVNVANINDAPSIGGANPGTTTIADTAIVQPFASVTISDDDGDILNVVVTMDGPAKGIFQNTSIGIYDPALGTYMVTGSASQVQAALRALQYNPRDKAAGAFAETTTFTISVDDNKAPPVTNANLKVLATSPGGPLPGNQPPTDITFNGGPIRELSADDALVATLGSVDADGVDGATYWLVNSLGQSVTGDGRFKIVNNELRVQNGVQLDFEQASSHQIRLRTFDKTGLSTDKIFSVGVLDWSPESTTGSVLNDVIKGGAGNDAIGGGLGDDQLWGGLGNDALTGGAGRDVFVFDTKLHKSKNKDTIKDYNVKEDAIRLENSLFKANKALFTATKKGTEARPTKMKSDFFTIGDKAVDDNDYFVYDAAKRVLYYDADGSGAAGAVAIATFTNNKALKNFTAKELFFI